MYWRRRGILSARSEWVTGIWPWELGIAYTPGHIELAYGGNYSFRRWLVDEAGKDQLGNFVGPFELPSLAFSPSGHPGISYYDSANSTIKYAAGTIVRMPLDAFFDFLDFLMQGVRQATRRVRSSLNVNLQLRRPDV